MNPIRAIRSLLVPEKPERGELTEKAQAYTYMIFPQSGEFYEITGGQSVYQDIYKTWIYACVDLIGWKAGTVEWKLLKDGESIEDPKFIRFMNSNNPYNFSQWLYIVIQDLDLRGDSLWWIDLKNQFLLYLNAKSVQPVVNTTLQKVEAYTYYDIDGQKKIPANEVLRIYRPKPFSPLEGFATVQSLSDITDIENRIYGFIRNSLKNGLSAAYIAQTDQPLTGLSEEERERIREQIRLFYSGSATAGKLLFLPGNIKITRLEQLDLKAFSEILPARRDEILGAFRTPASKLGLVEDVNRANAEANDLTFIKECILPRLALIEDAINTQLLPALGLKDLLFKFVPPTYEDPELALRRETSLLTSGVYTINEIRAKEGLSPVPWGDRPLRITEIEAQMGLANVEPHELVLRGFSESRIRDQNRGAYNRLVGMGYQRWTKHFRKLFIGSKTRTREYYDRFGTPTNDKVHLFLDFVFPDWREQQEIMQSKSREMLLYGYKEGRNIARGWFGKSTYPTIHKDLELEWANDVAVRTSTWIWENITAEIADVLGEGVDVEDVLTGLDMMASVLNNRTALFTARTEATTSLNAGMMDTFRDENIAMKEWRTVGDAATRESHIAAELQGPIPLDEPFDLMGESAMFPGDPGLSEENLINCRCWLLPVLEV